MLGIRPMARSSFLYILPLLPVLSRHYHLQHLNRLSRGPNERTQRTDRTCAWMDGWVFAFVRSCPQGEEEEEDELKL